MLSPKEYVILFFWGNNFFFYVPNVLNIMPKYFDASLLFMGKCKINLRVKMRFEFDLSFFKFEI